jgi:hypothetical protein
MALSLLFVHFLRWSTILRTIMRARSIIPALARPVTAATRLYGWRFQLVGLAGLRVPSECLAKAI